MDSNNQVTSCNAGEEIVISGIAGRFPNSDNMQQFQNNLFNEIDLATDDSGRWNNAEFEMPSRMGKINNIEKFDAQYFDISRTDTDALDPTTRMLLEHTYEAIIDAGVNPEELRGTNTGVFIGACYTTTFSTIVFKHLQAARCTLWGSKVFMANLISSWFDISGPSYVTDTACSSSLFALDHAYRRIKSGDCDAAIVAGANLCLHPYITYQFYALGVLSPDGYCRPFDEKASGYMRSDTVAVLFLQKAKDARRIYATCVNVKTNCDGFKEEGITYPSFHMQKALLEEVYAECRIAPSEIAYVEAHATGTVVGDPVEIRAIDEVFCKTRNSPLLVSAVKSNLGHSEPASGICQIAKVLIAMETGKIPATLHYKSPRKDLTAVLEGRIKIIDKLTSWNGGYAGVNSFGFGGGNCHVILKSNPKDKVKKLDDDLPRLVIVSGRTEEAVKTILDDVKSRPTDLEYIALLHCIYNKNIERHLYRGYAIIGSTEDQKSITNLEYDSNNQICFLFPGTDVILRNIDKELMKLPIFAKTIQKCDVVLKPHGICITDILFNNQEIACTDIIKSFVATISIQIATVDLLLHIGIVPDYVIGQSIGKLLCGYVDGLFTVEETISIAYYMGVAFEETKVEQCTSAISSQNVESTRLKLLEYLKQIVPRKSFQDYSKKWLHNLSPHSKTNNSFKQLSTAEYCAYSVLYSTPFEEILPLIPQSAIVIEIVPYNDWQFIMNKFLNYTYISLFKYGQRSNVDSILKGIGELYNIGLQPQVANLYPPVEFPVSRGTPMISPLVKWDHSEDRFVIQFKNYKKPTFRENTEIINDNYKYMFDHVIDGRNLMPASGYLFLIWKMIGTLLCYRYEEIPIVFEDVNFFRATHLSKKTAVKLTLSILIDSNKFEITEGNTAVVTGKVLIPKNIANHKLLTRLLNKPEHNVKDYMSTKDIYKELRIRGYQYSGVFRSLKSASITAKMGHIGWSDNWTAFIDNMLQMRILLLDSRSLYVPTKIRKLVIDPKAHIQQVQNMSDEKAEFPVHIYDSLDVIISGGIEIYGVIATSIPRRQTAEAIHEEYNFIAHCDRAAMSLKDIIQMSTHIALECNLGISANFVELIEDSDTVTEQDLMCPILHEILNNLPLIRPDITLVATANRFENSVLPPDIKQSDTMIKDENILMAIVFGILTKPESKLINELLSTLKEGSFLLSRENLTETYDYTLLQQYELKIVVEKCTEKEAFVLLRKIQSNIVQEIVHINNDDLTWINKLKSVMDSSNKLNDSRRIILVADDFECGILGFINCLRKEVNKNNDKIRCVFIQDKNAPKFSLQDSIYMNQLQLDLPTNVLRSNKVWGSYRHLPLPPLEPKLVHHAFVKQTVQGDLSKLRWVEGMIFPDDKQETLVRVVYASLNFKDVVLATGRISAEHLYRRSATFSPLGIEYAGFTIAGQRIAGISTFSGLTNLQVADPTISWIIPDTWTFEDAATVPAAYCTSYYALYTQGKIKKGDKVLIHSGTGAVGQSAIYLALYEGCEIFTTVGTPEKRNFIRERFPSIPEDHIGNSRDTTFEQMICQQTGGRGVDIVLNSLAEDKLQASVRCLARGGRFLEIGKYDLVSNNILDINVFSKGISFYGVQLDRLFLDANETRRISLRDSIQNLIQRGAVRPLVREVFEQHEVETAFKHMAAAKHIGKVLIKVRNGEKFLDAPILAYPQYLCTEYKSYIILGGLGGFGLELTDWLISRGARKIILISRTGISNGYQQSRVEIWKSYGANVQILAGIDASNHEDCAFILRSANELGPVDAIFNLAVVLKDDIYANQTPETFKETFQSKVLATRKLDELSRNMCPDLRHFVVFSSLSCGRGNYGQTNYGMANSIMERICEKRVQDGLPGMAIQWGAIGDVGLVAEMQQSNKELVICGTMQQRISSCLESLNTFLMQNRPIVSSMVVATKSSGNTDILRTVMDIMGLKTLQGVGLHTPLSELGMDSMTALEIKQTVEREFDIFFTAQELRTLTFAKIKDIINKDKNEQQHGEEQSDKNINALTLFQLISDIDLVSAICIELPTKREVGRNEIFLLPGIEGFANVYKSVSSNLKAPATCLQHSTINIPDSAESVVQSAADLLPHILSKLRDSTEFVIVAYSYGCLIAIEIVRLLEASNLRGQLILIDGAPKYMKQLQEEFFPFSNSQESQNVVLTKLMDVFRIPVSEQIILEINKYSTWEEKLSVLIKNITSEVITNILSVDCIKIFCTTIYKHLLAIKEYDMYQSSLIPIKSSVILLKATTPILTLVEEDYDLNKVCENVQVHYVESNHVSIINSDQVVAAINGEIKQKT